MFIIRNWRIIFKKRSIARFCISPFIQSNMAGRSIAEPYDFPLPLPPKYSTTSKTRFYIHDLCSTLLAAVIIAAAGAHVCLLPHLEEATRIAQGIPHDGYGGR